MFTYIVRFAAYYFSICRVCESTGATRAGAYHVIEISCLVQFQKSEECLTVKAAGTAINVAEGKSQSLSI